MAATNQFGQPIGESLADWSPCSRPADVMLEGIFCRLEPLRVERHATDLYEAYSSAPDQRDWTYLSTGPFHQESEYRQFVESATQSSDPRHFAVIDSTTGKAVGTLALMRIDAANGVIEVGHIAFSPLLKQRRASTEAQFLLMRYVFEKLQYRRYEWKCDSLNSPSRQAAERLGFRFEGIFRQAVVYKGRTRDTAWYSVIDQEWPALKMAFLAWLSAENFDDKGNQRRSLAVIRELQAP